MKRLVCLCAILAPSVAAADDRVMTISPPRAAEVSIKVPSGNFPLSFRRSANVYSVVGAGTFRTMDCTYNPRGLEVVLSRADVRGRRWATFVDRDGEAEATCQVDDRPYRAPLPVARVVIRRGIATTGGR